MLPDLLQLLVQSTIASSAAILLVLVLRRPLRAAFGAGIAYALWASTTPLLLIALMPTSPWICVGYCVVMGAVGVASVALFGKRHTLAA